MLLIIKLVAPVITGAVVGSVAMFGLVYSQTAAPDVNPASKPIITYGDK